MVLEAGTAIELIPETDRTAMSRLTYVTTLDDAYFFLNQSKGLPKIPSVKPLQQRLARACILHSWIALEEMLDYAIEDLRKQGKMKEPPARPLSEKLKAVLSARGSLALDMKDFSVARKVRNILVHPTPNKSEDHFLTLEQASSVFNYCLTTIRAISPYNVTLRI